MNSINLISNLSAVLITFLISSIFIIIGLYYSKKFSGLNNYLVANRSIETFSLTTSLIASALGAWILFGPASAATWGGIGAVLGYTLGTAFPFLILVYLGPKFRIEFPKAKTFIEVIRLKFNTKIYKLILFISIFYMTIFLIAEITAVSILIKYISNTSLWITALIVILSSLTYTLYGGLRTSIFTDKFQFIIFLLLLVISFTYLFFNYSNFSFNFIAENKPMLMSHNYIANYTAGFTFFIAVAATNLFHQGNWQRVYAAKSNKVLNTSLMLSFIIVIPIVFLMGFSGLISISENSKVIPDLAFFSLLLKDNNLFFSILIILLAISLTISSIDTLINAISSLIIVDGNNIIKSNTNFKSISKIIIILLSLITFVIASKGLSILYLFLLADMFCCSAVITIFYNFYIKKTENKNIYIPIIIGLIGGLMFFPSPDFSKSLLVGFIYSKEVFPNIVSNSLLFFSFLFATFLPIIFLIININKISNYVNIKYKTILGFKL